MTQQPRDVPANMRNYFVGLLLKGAEYSDEQTPALADLQLRHLAYLRRCVEEHRFLAVGPVMDSSSLCGLTVIDAASAVEAAELMAGDPAVQAGRFTFEVHPLFWPSLDGVRIEYP